MFTHLQTMRTPIHKTLLSITDPLPTEINLSRAQSQVLLSTGMLIPSSPPHVATMAQVLDEPNSLDPVPTKINPTDPCAQSQVLLSTGALNANSQPLVATMSHLPNELWLQALDCVPRSDLPSVSRTSKHFHELVEPILYRDFDSTKHKDGPNIALVRLLRTLVNRPDLAYHVKNITLRVMIDPHAERLQFGTLDISFLTSDDQAWMKKQMSLFAPTKGISDNWISIMVSETNWEGVAAFLLLIVSQNLQSLIMKNYGAMSQYQFIHHLMRYWADLSRTLDHEGCHPFSQMGEICLYKNDDIRPSNFLSLRTTLPYLKYNFVSQFIGHGISDASFQLDSNTILTTQSVALHDCRITNATLKRFLGSFGSLKIFQWVDENAVSVGDIFTVLQDVPGLKGHLEELIIDNASNADAYTSPPAYDWSKYRALRSITVDAASIFGVIKPILEMDPSHSDPDLYGQTGDTYGSVKHLGTFINALPSTLETLKITKCQSPIFDCALRIISHKRKNTFYKLNQMTLSFDDTILAHRRARLNEYMMIARKSGVKLVLLGYRIIE
ncbi:uncharacterized protein PAC_08977 [Phialocephala subalpina]|uniref:F-box domain-containing protein n=1 Tax=Phialocephala subalpina TaxID=576137 RepID=A0A1L7X233_9HELO|nr:uncharacterized protein PAC_08977 [Phialocephala subalpina]